MLKCNVLMEQILTEYRDADALPQKQAFKFKRAAFAMGQLLTQLAEHFLQEGGHHLFDITSKLHMVLHAAVLAEHINPRKVWCFTGEDFMHIMQTLAQSCTRGANGPAAVSKMIAHYRLGMHFRFTSP